MSGVEERTEEIAPGRPKLGIDLTPVPREVVRVRGRQREGPTDLLDLVVMPELEAVPRVLLQDLRHLGLDGCARSDETRRSRSRVLNAVGACEGS